MITQKIKELAKRKIFKQARRAAPPLIYTPSEAEDTAYQDWVKSLGYTIKAGDKSTRKVNNDTTSENHGLGDVVEAIIDQREREEEFKMEEQLRRDIDYAHSVLVDTIKTIDDMIKGWEPNAPVQEFFECLESARDGLKYHIDQREKSA